MSARTDIASAAQEHGWAVEWNTGDGMCSVATKGKRALSLDLSRQGALRSVRVFHVTDRGWLNFVKAGPGVARRQWVVAAMADPQHEAWTDLEAS